MGHEISTLASEHGPQWMNMPNFASLNHRSPSAGVSRNGTPADQVPDASPNSWGSVSCEWACANDGTHVAAAAPAPINRNRSLRLTAVALHPFIRNPIHAHLNRRFWRVSTIQ